MDFSNMNTKEIDNIFKGMDVLNYPEFIPLLLKDKRKSIKKLGYALETRYKKYNEEYKRVMELWEFERDAFVNGYHLVAGIDEAGRGPLAGPVVASAVILPKELYVEGINDSKKLSKIKRESIFNIIQKEALAIGVGIIDNSTIDEVNILNATKLAMISAIKNLNPLPQYLLIDALELSDINIKQKGIIGGDQKSISIAAASIIAKVTRDKIMEDYDSKYPSFGFSIHKGYGTNEHYEAIKKYGLTPIHRKTFLKNMGGDYCEDRQAYNGQNS